MLSKICTLYFPSQNYRFRCRGNSYDWKISLSGDHLAEDDCVGSASGDVQCKKSRKCGTTIFDDNGELMMLILCELIIGDDGLFSAIFRE